MARTTRLAIVAAMAIGMVGCATDPTEFRLVGFTADEYQALRLAADEWCTDTDGEYCPTLSGGDNSIELVPSIGERKTAVGRADVSASVLGKSASIVIVDKRDQPGWLEHLRQVALHELGHAGGCALDMGPGHVMSAEVEGSAPHLTTADVRCVTGN